MRLLRLPVRPISGGIGFPAGFLAATLVTVAAVGAQATAHPQRSLIPLVITVAVVAIVSTFRAALATAAVCWALHTGFVLNRRGDLVWTVQSAPAAALLAAVAITAYAVAIAVRVGGRYRREPDVVIPAQRSVTRRFRVGSS